LRENLYRTSTAVIDTLDTDGLGCEIAQYAQTALPDYALGHFGDDTQHPGDPDLVVIHGTVGKRVVGLFRETATLEEQQQSFIPGCLTARQNVLNTGPDVRPDLLPDLIGSRAQHPVALETYSGQIGVIAEESQLRTPRHPHCVA